jgi:hypothetical protein
VLWLGYRLHIGWCYWDYPVAPISLYVVVGLLAHIPKDSVKKMESVFNDIEEDDTQQRIGSCMNSQDGHEN